MYRSTSLRFCLHIGDDVDIELREGEVESGLGELGIESLVIVEVDRSLNLSTSNFDFRI